MKMTWKISPAVLVIGAGAVLGVLGAVLAWAGNPANMGLCIACFIRDIAGALGLHRAAPVQYLRPEIPALILGAVVAAAVSREFKARSAPATAVSFLLGALVMMGAMAFLGCPVRMVLRLAGGDLNAAVGFGGFLAGILVGVFMLRRGFSLGRAAPASYVSALVLPMLALGLLVLLWVRPAFIFFSDKGPGSQAASVWLSLGAGLVVGFLAQRSRLCFAGGIRDMLLIRSPHLLVGLVAVLVAACAANLVLGSFRLSFAGQPAAHTEHVWNFLGMSLVGLGSVLLGGCPLRQLVLAGGGSGAAFAAVGGMLVGAAAAHNFGLAASASGVPLGGKAVVVAGLVVCAVIGWSMREK